jgi:hypothetical protein
VNVPLTISAVVTSPLRLATLHELQTVYGTEDLFNFLEIASVNQYNERLQAKHQRD